MFYFIPFKKFKSLPNLTFKVFGKDDLEYKSISPKKVGSIDLEKSDIKELTDFEEIDLFSKIAFANSKQQNLIKLVKENDNIVFSTNEDFGVYLGLSELKVEGVFVSTDFHIQDKQIKSLNSSDLPTVFNTKGFIKWDVPKFEVINEWDNKDYVINLLKERYPNYGDIFRLSSQEVLLSEDVIDLYVSKESIQGCITWDILDSEVYKNAILKNPANMFFHYKTYLVDILARQLYPLFSKIDNDETRTGKFNICFFKSNNYKEYVSNNEISKELDHVQWFWDNLFSDFDKCVEFGNICVDSLNLKSYSHFMEVYTLFDRDFFKTEKVQNIVRKAYSKWNRDYGSEYLNKYIPSDYFSDKEVCEKFIKDEILAGQSSAEQIFNVHIQKHFKNDTNFFFDLLDFIDKNAPSNNIENLRKTIISRFSDFAAYDEKQKVEYLKLQLIAGRVNFSSWHYNPYIVSIYEKYLEKDEELMNFIIDKVPPKNAVSLPNSFLYRIQNKNYIQKLVSSDSSLLLSKKAPLDWIYDVELIIIAGAKSHDIKFNKKEFKKIVPDKITALRLVNSNPFLLKFLPTQYLSDKEVVLSSITKRQTVAKDCNQSLFLDVDFCIQILNKNAELFSLIPKIHLNDSVFMTKLFKGLDNGSISSSVTKYFPQEIIKCLSAFNVKIGGYEEFATSFFVKQLLTSNLKSESSEKFQNKKLKI